MDQVGEGFVAIGLERTINEPLQDISNHSGAVSCALSGIRLLRKLVNKLGESCNSLGEKAKSRLDG